MTLASHQLSLGFLRVTTICVVFPIVVGSLGTGGESDGDYSDDDDEDQGSETNGSMTEDYTDLATSQDGHQGDSRDIAVMRQQMEGKRRLDDSKEQSRWAPFISFIFMHFFFTKILPNNRFSPQTQGLVSPVWGILDPLL